MRSVHLFWIIVCAGGLCSAGRAAVESPAQPAEVLARWQFIGTDRLAKDTNTAKLQQIWALPSSRALREHLLRRLARVPQEFWVRSGNQPVKDGSSQVRPLLEDLLRSESCLEVRGQGGRATEWTLAIELDHERARLWSTNLAQMLAGWNLGNITPKTMAGCDGWEIANPKTPFSFCWARSGRWGVFGAGQAPLVNYGRVLAEIQRGQRPMDTLKEGWLAARVNPPFLSRHLRRIPLFSCWSETMPALELLLSSRADNVRSRLSLQYPQAQSWRLESWRIPTNSIYEPLVSFTAAQGIAPWLARWDYLKKLDVAPAPNQAYAWANAQVPFQTFLAFPVREANRVSDRVASRLSWVIASNDPVMHFGEIGWETNRTEVVWRGWPFVVPFLRPMIGAGQEYLVAGLFPLPPKPTPPPGELLSQVVGRTNLLYYDWELTRERLSELRVLEQLFELVTTRKARPAGATTGSTNDVGVAWREETGKLLGNSITELTVVSPRELVLVRKSPIGFSALELVYLARWFNDPAFPGLSPKPAMERAPKAKPPMPSRPAK